MLVVQKILTEKERITSEGDKTRQCIKFYSLHSRNAVIAERATVSI